MYFVILPVFVGAHIPGSNCYTSALVCCPHRYADIHTFKLQATTDAWSAHKIYSNLIWYTSRDPTMPGWPQRLTRGYLNVREFVFCAAEGFSEIFFRLVWKGIQNDTKLTSTALIVSSNCLREDQVDTCFQNSKKLNRRQYSRICLSILLMEFFFPLCAP